MAFSKLKCLWNLYVYRSLGRLNQNALEISITWNFVKLAESHVAFFKRYTDPGSMFYHHAEINFPTCSISPLLGICESKTQAIVRLSLCAKIQGDVNYSKAMSHTESVYSK